MKVTTFVAPTVVPNGLLDVVQLQDVAPILALSMLEKVALDRVKFTPATFIVVQPLLATVVVKLLNEKTTAPVPDVLYHSPLIYILLLGLNVPSDILPTFLLPVVPNPVVNEP